MIMKLWTNLNLIDSEGFIKYPYIEQGINVQKSFDMERLWGCIKNEFWCNSTTGTIDIFWNKTFHNVWYTKWNKRHIIMAAYQGCNDNGNNNVMKS